MNNPIPVIFRVFPDGQVIALFPDMAGDMNPHTCNSYMHIGQHGSADPNLVYETRLATSEEYTALLKELQSIGYENIVIKKRFTYRNFLNRKQEIEL